MLTVRGLAKQYPLEGHTRTLFRDLSFDLPRDGRLALLGRNGQGKSTLIKIIGGVVEPTAGQVKWSMSCSWPLGFAGAFQGGMTGLDNIRFLARIYRRPIKGLIERVDEFAQLGKMLAMPVKYYSSGMRARLAFGLSLAIEFDCYLIDEVISVGDALFRRKCEDELFSKRAHRAFVIASHDLDLLRLVCNRAIVIEDGQARLYEDIEEAIAVYRTIWENQEFVEAPEGAGVGPIGAEPADPPLPGALAPPSTPVSHDEAVAAAQAPGWWSPEMFHSPGTPDGRCPDVIAVTGRPRDLIFGPYISLAPGVWRATVFLEVCANASRCRLDLEFGVFPNYSKNPVTFLGPGHHKLEIEYTVAEAGDAEVRIVLIRPGFQGELRFAGVTVERIADAPALAEVAAFPRFNTN
jgi:capsular polysaccharide transport system ATP-binding protein